MKPTLPLILATLLTIPAPHAFAQTPDKVPVYAVSTVKASRSATGMTKFFFTPSGLSTENIPLQNIIRDAYGLQDDQLAGLPAWVKSAHYDIEAKVDDEDRPAMSKLTQPQRAAMLQPLLAERFKLKTHLETRELPVYTLVIAKSGLKIKETQPTPAEEGKTQQHGFRMSRGELKAADAPMDLLARILSQLTHHIVVNKTGLTAHYDFTLQWTDENAPADTDSSIAPSIFTALQEQLGLKLDPVKTSMPVLVIDHIEQPTPD